MFTRKEPSFMCDRTRASTMWWVSSASGRCRQRKSDSRTTVSKSVSATPRSASASATAGEGLSTHPMARMPHAAPISPTRLPMRPAPTMPRVFPASRGPPSWALGQCPSRRSRSARATFRTSASSRPKVSSATGCAEDPGTRTMRMPRAWAWATSMLSSPEPARSSSSRFGAASRTVAEIMTPLRKMTTSRSATSSTSCSSGALNARTTSWSFSRALIAAGSMELARRIFTRASSRRIR
jgi:hypothetical protein